MGKHCHVGSCPIKTFNGVFQAGLSMPESKSKPFPLFHPSPSGRLVPSWTYTRLRFKCQALAPVLQPTAAVLPLWKFAIPAWSAPAKCSQSPSAHTPQCQRRAETLNRRADGLVLRRGSFERSTALTTIVASQSFNQERPALGEARWQNRWVV